MKKMMFLSTLLVVALPAAAQSTTDTVIVRFGEQSRMTLYVDNEDDLRQLRTYDLAELLDNVDSLLFAEEAARPLEIELEPSDASGDDETLAKRKTVIRTYDNGKVRIRYEVAFDRTSDEAPERDDAGSEDDDDDDEDKDDSNRKRQGSRFDSDLLLDLGLNNYLENGNFPDADGKAYGLRPLGSRYVALGSMTTMRIGGTKSPLRIQSGLTFSWYNFMFEEDVVIRKGPEQVAFEPLVVNDDTLVGLDKSKLTVSFVNVPLNFYLKFRQGFRIGGGGYLGYRLGSHSKVKYDLPGDRNNKDKERTNFYLNSWRYGLSGLVGYKDLTLFFNYDINTIFREERGPELNAFSMGLRFLL